MNNKRPAPKCPACGAIMNRAYIRTSIKKKQAYSPVGWLCMGCELPLYKIEKDVSNAKQTSEKRAPGSLSRDSNATKTGGDKQ